MTTPIKRKNPYLGALTTIDKHLGGVMLGHRSRKPQDAGAPAGGESPVEEQREGEAPGDAAHERVEETAEHHKRMSAAGSKLNK